MAAGLDPRVLRYFVAVAEDLHFTRAAARVHVVQQALSREIRRLERQLGVRLFIRTTRRVVLAPEGEHLLPRARVLLALHDRTLGEMGELLEVHPLRVDLLAEGHTPVRVLRGARLLAPGVEFVARFHGGFGAAVGLLLAGRLDVAFGRCDGLVPPFPTDHLARTMVRLEPMALLLLEEHPLAARSEVPMAALRGTQIDASLGNEEAPEWVDLGVRLLTAFGAEPSPPHLHAEGLAETVQHLRSHGRPILTLVERPVAPGVVVRPLVDPVPVYRWTMAYRRDLKHDGLAALDTHIEQLAHTEHWREPPPNAWICETD